MQHLSSAESRMPEVLLSADLLPGVIAHVKSLRSAAGVCQLWRDLAAAHVKAERRHKILLLRCGGSGVIHVFDVVQRAWSVQHTPWNSQTRVCASTRVPEGGSAALVAGILHVEVMVKNATGLIARYDPLDNAWLPLLPVHSHQREFAMAAVGSRLSLVGGTNSRAMSVLDLCKVPWQWIAVEGASYGQASMHLDRTCASASAFDGQLWLVGGFSTRLRCDLASVLRWLPSTAAWAEVAPLPTARRGVATCWCHGKLYALSGAYCGDTLAATVRRYCPGTNSWEELRDMPRGRFGFAAVSRLGKVYVFGGTATPCDRVPLTKVDVYDPALEAWSTLSAECDLPLDRGHCAREEVLLVHAW